MQISVKQQLRCNFSLNQKIKDVPIVEIIVGLKGSPTTARIREVLPTPDSPSRTILYLASYREMSASPLGFASEWPLCLNRPGSNRRIVLAKFRTLEGLLEFEAFEMDVDMGRGTPPPADIECEFADGEKDGDDFADYWNGDHVIRNPNGICAALFAAE